MTEIENDMANFERETHFNISAADRATCEVFTDDPVWFRRLSKWFEPAWCDGQAARFVVPTALVIRESALVSGNERLEQLRNDLAGETQPAPG